MEHRKGELWKTHMLPAALASTVSNDSRSLMDSIWEIPALGSYIATSLISCIRNSFFNLLKLGGGSCNPPNVPKKTTNHGITVDKNFENMLKMTRVVYPMGNSPLFLSLSLAYDQIHFLSTVHGLKLPKKIQSGLFEASLPSRIDSQQ